MWLISCWVFPRNQKVLLLLKPCIHDGELVAGTELQESLTSIIALTDTMFPTHTKPQFSRTNGGKCFIHILVGVAILLVYGFM